MKRAVKHTITHTNEQALGGGSEHMCPEWLEAQAMVPRVQLGVIFLLSYLGGLAQWHFSCYLLTVGIKAPTF